MAPPTTTSQLRAKVAAASPANNATASSPSLSSSLDTLIHSYKTTTPSKIKLIDCFLLFLLCSGVVQFAYCALITSFPYNAFLGGDGDWQDGFYRPRSFIRRFAAAAGQFVLLAGLRAQVAPSLTASPAGIKSTSSSSAGEGKEFPQVSQERAFADFCFASVILHFFVYNFLG